MSTTRPYRQARWVLVPAAIVAVVVIAAGVLLATRAPAPPPASPAPAAQATVPASPAASPQGSSPGIAVACDPATVEQLAQAVSHEWAAQGATKDQLIALNEALFTCEFGSRTASGCDIAALAALQLAIAQVEATGLMPAVADQARFDEFLRVCMGQLPGEAAAGPAPSPGSSPGTADCAALWADWALHGTPELATVDQLVAFYQALRTCFPGTPGLACDLAALAQAQLDMRTSSFAAWDTARGAAAEPNLLACLGPNPALLAGLGGLAAANGGASGGGRSGGGGSGGGTGGGGSPAPESASPPPSDGPLPGGPYAVKQLESLGGEKISGLVCSTSRPFRVPAATSKVAWSFVFAPRNGQAGGVSYAYSIRSAGESHAATGTYTIAGPDHDGTLHLSLRVSDHVVFKGFDGKIPLRYKFDLVPTGAAGCP